MWRINSNDFICGTDWKIGQHRINLGNAYDTISKYPIPLVVGLFSRLAEIGTRTTFIVIASTVSLLFEELNQRMENLTKKSNNSTNLDSKEMSKNIHEWKTHYDLVIQFANIMNCFFGPSLLVTYTADYAVAFLEFQNIMNFEGLNSRYYLQFFHICLRFLLILTVSQRVETKVKQHEY